MPLSDEYLRSLRWEDVCSRFRNFHYAAELPTSSRSEVVFISSVLPHLINDGYHDVRQAVVTHVNGRAIATLSDLAEALKEPADYYVFDVDHHAIPGEYSEFAGTKIVIDGREVSQANTDIADAFRLPALQRLT